YGGNDAEAGSSRSKRSRQFETVEEVLLPQVHNEFLLWEGCSWDAKSRQFETVEEVLLPQVHNEFLLWEGCSWDAKSRDLIDSEGRLIPEDPQPGVPIVGVPRPPRASIQDLYDRKERMEYRQSYHWERYQGVFEHMAGVYNVPLQGAYNPPGYAQPQHD
nr:hypothetical protein [Tanacetum cinerariifolium]